jgi:hypothetical protein
MADHLDTHSKALRINLDGAIFGSFAEIGAGQEVARWFLQVGGASRTVAKTISAYDKEVSDDLYGQGSRYVSRQRLEAMLDREWGQLAAQLDESRGRTTRFFTLADTVAARNFGGTNECHGWMGIRFQDQPGGEPNEVVLHVNMRDPSNLLQQEALGVLGVNLVYGVIYGREKPDAFLHAFLDDLAPGRIEIDLVDVRGRAFEGWDRAASLVELVRGGLAEGVVFSREGAMVPPTEVFHNKPIVLAPGTFAKVEPFHGRLLATALEKLSGHAEKPTGLFSLTAASLLEDVEPPSVGELLQRIEALRAQGSAVLLSKDRELFRMTSFVNRFTKEPVRLAVGLTLLVRVFHDAHYRELDGRMLEGIARLFADNVKVYAYPMTAADWEAYFHALPTEAWVIERGGEWVTAEQLKPPPPLCHLYAYLLGSGFIVPMEPPG